MSGVLGWVKDEVSKEELDVSVETCEAEWFGVSGRLGRISVSLY